MSTDTPVFGNPYWWEHGSPLPELTTRLPESADLLIVGAGYTGMSAAIAASDAGAHVVVVDRDTPGIGASTRNGGMFGAHPRFGFKRLCDMFGEPAAIGIFNEAQDAFDFTAGLIERENIDCHFQQSGRIQLAWSEKHLQQQKQQVADLTATTNMKLEFVHKDELASDINTPCYHGGIRFPEHASLHPRQFHDGLMAACLQRGVQIVQQCQINRIERAKGSFAAVSADGSKLRAEKVLMATNGYTSGDFNWLKRRVFPLPSYLIATEPVSKNLIDYLAPGKRMMVETRARHSYFRVSPDGSRMLFGGRASMRDIPLPLAAARLHSTLAEIWPELSDVKVSHCWSGNTGYSFTHMPQVGEHKGIHYALGYSGSGTAIAPYLGAKAAYQAIGDARGETAYSLTTLETKWIHPMGKPHFLKPVDLWYRNVIDRLQSLG